MNPNSAELLNSMLVPGMMIVAASILLLSINGKYTSIVNRIRLLKDERAKIIEENNLLKIKRKKIDKIELQLSHLIHRISMVRITIVSFSAAVLFFTVCCILISIRSDFRVNGYFWLALAFFFAGLLSIINGVVFSVIEVFKGYRIVQIEISELNPDALEEGSKSS
jgi:hypothetical protein